MRRRRARRQVLGEGMAVATLAAGNFRHPVVTAVGGKQQAVGLLLGQINFTLPIPRFG